MCIRDRYMGTHCLRSKQEVRKMDPRNSGAIVLAKVFDHLHLKGNNVIRRLGKVFRQLRSFDGAKKVDTDDFIIALKELGIPLSRQESDVLGFYLDRSREGRIDFSDFLSYIRGSPSPKRQELIDKAFASVDKDNVGYLTVNDVKGLFDATLHPKVKSGELTRDEVITEFLQNFAYVSAGIIQRDEWNDYYAAVSNAIDNDDFFAVLMLNTWRVKQKFRTKEDESKFFCPILGMQRVYFCFEPPDGPVSSQSLCYVFSLIKSLLAAAAQLFAYIYLSLIHI
eukprot:TRINITY_DN8387_c0_g1_i2.p1 TRINITY_DN8387_c0_g1~~TRINITY_DN8387_c0_g1_i2.p1  ORF type:complete len:301 (-),score=83.24 TRINITY_DN8387_c0_g1_i2:62-904(-)